MRLLNRFKSLKAGAWNLLKSSRKSFSDLNGASLSDSLLGEVAMFVWIVVVVYMWPSSGLRVEYLKSLSLSPTISQIDKIFKLWEFVTKNNTHTDSIGFVSWRLTYDCSISSEPQWVRDPLVLSNLSLVARTRLYNSKFVVGFGRFFPLQHSSSTELSVPFWLPPLVSVCVCVCACVCWRS